MRKHVICPTLRSPSLALVLFQSFILPYQCSSQLLFSFFTLSFIDYLSVLSNKAHIGLALAWPTRDGTELPTVHTPEMSESSILSISPRPMRSLIWHPVHYQRTFHLPHDRNTQCSLWARMLHPMLSQSSLPFPNPPFPSRLFLYLRLCPLSCE